MRGTTYAACIGIAVAITAQAEPEIIHTEIDETVRLYMDQFRIAGVAICVIDDGEIIHDACYGVADAAIGEPITSDSRFQIASISKLFTAWSVMLLAQEERIDLDEPIWHVLNGWRIDDTSFDEDGVTARRLLSHTAGVSLWAIPKQPIGSAVPATRAWLESGDEGASPVTLEAEPGSRFRYSGGGMTILQLAVEEITGRSYAEFVSERIALPLGIPTLGFNLWPGDWNAAAPHNALGDPKQDRWTYPSLAAAAGWASLEDMKQFAYAHFDMPGRARGGRVLEQETFDQMLELQREARGQWTLGYEAFPEKKRPRSEVFGHTGDNPGWHGLFYVAPRNRDALIILTNGELGYAFRNMIRPVWSRAVDLENPWPERKAPIGPTLIGVAVDHGAEAAITEYKRRAATQKDHYNFGVRQLNDLAYFLWEAKRFDEAMKILVFNTELYPDSTTAWDSLAEGHFELGNMEESQRCYERVLEIDPDRQNVKDMLMKIRQAAESRD